MATTVQSFVGGGTDLTELTSGELLFCSLLKMGHTFIKPYNGYGAYVEFGYDYDFDMSKISQISFESRHDYSGSGYVYWKSKNNSANNITRFSANTNFSINAPSGDNSHSSFTISGDDKPGGSCFVKVTSFTTTDGKVHTASNLNY